MINLRFHIVSIVAVFLALALGIVTGSTLLDRVTVQQLESTQSQIERKIQEKSEQNDALRRRLDLLDAQSDSFARNAVDDLIPGLIDRTPVLVVATRGIDETALRDAERDLRRAGAVTYGTVWLDQRLDLTRPETIAALARLYGAEIGDIDSARAAQLRQRFIDEFAGALASTTVEGRPVTQATTSASAPSTPELLARLASDGLLDWDVTESPDVVPRTLPPSGARVVIVSGEGSSVPIDTTVMPVVRALAKLAPGRFVAAEVVGQRSSADAANQTLDTRQPQRGLFADLVRASEDLVATTVSIDDLDQVFGRLALIFVVAGDVPNGRFGMLPSAESVFPSRA